MLYQIETMFDDMEKKTRKLKKQKYEEIMETFMADNEAYFLEMETYLAKENPEAAAKEISKTIVDAVKSRYEVKGKIKGTVEYGVGIYYLFKTMRRIMC